MSQSVTSEEKLLKLIRKKEQSNKTGKKRGILQEFLFGTEGFDGSFKFLNRFFIILICLSLLIIFSKLLFVKESTIEFSAPKGKESVDKEPSELHLAIPEPFESYDEIIKKRNIFEFETEESKQPSEVVPSPEAPPSPPPPPEPVAQTTIQDVTRNLKLVGIVLTKEPEAVVEDSEKNETLFLHKGDQVNGAAIEEIKEGLVVFTLNGQRMEWTQ